MKIIVDELPTKKEECLFHHSESSTNIDLEICCLSIKNCTFPNCDCLKPVSELHAVEEISEIGAAYKMVRMIPIE